MPRLKTLKSKFNTLGQGRVAVIGRIGATPRQRGSTWMKRRAKWLSQHPMCCQCEAEGVKGIVATEVDHVTPLWEGGKDDDTNLQSLCYSHHKAKTKSEAARRGGGV